MRKVLFIYICFSLAPSSAGSCFPAGSLSRCSWQVERDGAAFLCPLGSRDIGVLQGSMLWETRRALTERRRMIPAFPGALQIPAVEPPCPNAPSRGRWVRVVIEVDGSNHGCSPKSSFCTLWFVPFKPSAVKRMLHSTKVLWL